MIKRLALSAMLALASLALAQSPQVRASAVELRSEKNNVVAHPLGSVFDTRNLLRVDIAVTTPTASVSNDQSAAIRRLADAVNAADTMTAGATRLFNNPINATENIGQLAQTALSALSAFDEQTRRRIAGEEGLPTDPPGPAGTYVRVARGLRKYAEEQLAQITTAVRSRSAVGTGAQFDITLTVVQSREQRQGRTYVKDLKDLLVVTEAERQLAASLTPEQLAAKLKAWSEEVQTLVKKGYEDSIKPKIDALATVVGETSPQIVALRQLVADMSTITPANAESVLASLPGKLDAAIALVEQLRMQAETEVDALIAAVKDLAAQVKTYVESRLNLGRLVEIARQVRNFVLGEGESKSFKIGSKTEANAPDIEVPLENGDKVEIVVTAKPVGDPNASRIDVLKQSSRGYKLGDNLLRTVTYNWYQQEDSSRTRNAPSINFLAKRFGRNLAGNTTKSIGIGAAWFPIGVDQRNSGTSQQALGIVASLFDDWLSIGYARNLSTNKNFIFAGLMLPIRF